MSDANHSRPQGHDGVTQVTICGGGNSSHALLALLASRPDKYRVNVLSTFRDEAERWQKASDKAGGIIARRDGETFGGKPNLVTNDVELAVKGSHVIVLAVPAFAHHAYLKAIRPHLQTNPSRPQMVGSLMAYGGFGVAANDALGDSIDQVQLFAIEMLPWATRIAEYGTVVDILATKKRCDVAVRPTAAGKEVMAVVQDMLTEPPQLNLVPNFLTLTLMNINCVWHPCLTYGCYRNWDGKTPFQEKPLFYEGCDEWTGKKLMAVGDDIMKIKAAIEAQSDVDLSGVVHVFDWMKRAYKGDMEDTSSLDRCFVTNKGYKGLTHPMIELEDGKGYLPNFEYRYLTEDIPYGLTVLKGVAELAGVDTPSIDDVIAWASGKGRLNKDFLKDGKLAGKDLNETRAPQRYGITDLAALIKASG